MCGASTLLVNVVIPIPQAAVRNPLSRYETSDQIASDACDSPFVQCQQGRKEDNSHQNCSAIRNVLTRAWL